MSHLLVWPLSETLKIVLSSHGADLGTITCCDKLDLTLYHQDAAYALQVGMTGCALSAFQQMLQQLATGTQMSGSFNDVIFLGRDQLQQVLVEIRLGQDVLNYSVVTLEVIESWAAQLDLLQVVMEENENEKKSRGTGCCG